MLGRGAEEKYKWCSSGLGKVPPPTHPTPGSVSYSGESCSVGKEISYGRGGMGLGEGVRIQSKAVRNATNNK